MAKKNPTWHNKLRQNGPVIFGRSHIIQVVVFDTFINACVPNLKNRDRPKSVVLSQWSSFGHGRQTKIYCISDNSTPLPHLLVLLIYTYWLLDLYDPPLCYPETRICFPSVTIRDEAINHVHILPPKQSYLYFLPLHQISHVYFLSHSYSFICTPVTLFQLSVPSGLDYPYTHSQQRSTFHKVLSIIILMCRIYWFILYVRSL